MAGAASARVTATRAPPGRWRRCRSTSPAAGCCPAPRRRWLEPRRRELADIRLQALEVIGRAGLSLGGTQLGSVERAARTLIETEPYRESGYVLLMEALEAQGNVAEGLRVFERLRSLLRDELGTVPSPEAMQAHERLLHPSAAGAARAPSRHAGSQGGDRASRPSCGPPARRALVGRPGGDGTAGGVVADAGRRAGDAPGRRSGHRQDAAAGRDRRSRLRDPGRSCWRDAPPRRRWCRTSRSWRRSASTCSARRWRSCDRVTREYGAEIGTPDPGAAPPPAGAAAA